MKIEGAWVLACGSGYFGSAFQFSNGILNYWMYTDVIFVGDTPRTFPETGTYKIKGNEITIHLKNEKSPIILYLITIDDEQYLSEYIKSVHKTTLSNEDIIWSYHLVENFQEKDPFDYQTKFEESGKCI